MGRKLTFLIFLTFAIVVACGSIASDELACEEAVSRLEDCCPSVDVRRFSCEEGCNGQTIVISERASKCIRERSCGDLSQRGICPAMTRFGNEPYPSQKVVEIEQEACK